MMDLIRSLWSREGIRYLFFGALTTVVSTVTFWLALVCGIPYLVSNVISWVLAVAFAFVTNKLFVFCSPHWNRDSIREALSFASSRILTLLLGQGILFAGVEWLGLGELLAKILSQVAEIAVNYILSKLLVFVKGKN